MLRAWLVAASFVLFGTSAPALATVFTFNFDSTAITNNTSTPTSNAAVQSYMNGILPGITVTGAGGLSNSNYTGDGHVIGPVSNGSVNPLTLGNTNGGLLDSPAPAASRPDGYIVNSGADRITLTLPTGTNAAWISFDFEIFPDGTCPTLSNCGGSGNPNLPDFEFLANGVPATNWVKYAVIPTSPNNHSPASGPTGAELAPQYLGTLSLAVNGANVLQFVDWPQRIGIDNLVVTTVPEPGTMLLAGIAAAALLLTRARKGSPAA